MGFKLCSQWRIKGPTGRKNLFLRPPPLISGFRWPDPPPSSEGLDPPLIHALPESSPLRRRENHTAQVFCSLIRKMISALAAVHTVLNSFSCRWKKLLGHCSQNLIEPKPIDRPFNESINQSTNQPYLNTVNGSASWFSDMPCDNYKL